MANRFISSIRSFFRASSPSAAAGATTARNILPPSIEDLTSVSAPEKVAAVYSCVRLISESIAKIPLEYKRYSSVFKCYRADFRDPLYNILTLRPNVKQTAFDLIRAAVADMYMEGNACIYIRRNALGEPQELVLLSGVTYDKANNTYYVMDPVNNITGEVPASDIIHLRNFGFADGLEGMSTVRQAARILGISAAADQEIGSLFATGGRVQGFLSGAGVGGTAWGDQLTDELTELRDDFVRRLRNGEKLLVLPGEIKFNNMTMTPTDVQLLENKKFTVKEIGRFFRVHPSLLYEEGGGSTYNTAEMVSVAFLNDTLGPLLTQIEQEFMAKLVRPDGVAGHRIEFYREALFNTDFSTKANYIKTTIETGVKTVNEWRRTEGRSAVEGGDEPLISANVVTLKSRVAEQPVEPITEPKPNNNE